MPDLLPNIPLPKGIMVDLYAASGLAVGSDIIVTNCGTNRIQLFEQAVEPDPNTDGFLYLTACKNDAVSVSAEYSNSPTGAWAYSSEKDSVVNVQVSL